MWGKFEKSAFFRSLLDTLSIIFQVVFGYSFYLLFLKIELLYNNWCWLLQDSKHPEVWVPIESPKGLVMEGSSIIQKKKTFVQSIRNIRILIQKAKIYLKSVKILLKIFKFWGSINFFNAINFKKYFLVPKVFTLHIFKNKS